MSGEGYVEVLRPLRAATTPGTALQWDGLRVYVTEVHTRDVFHPPLSPAAVLLGCVTQCGGGSKSEPDEHQRNLRGSAGAQEDTSVSQCYTYQYCSVLDPGAAPNVPSASPTPPPRRYALLADVAVAGPSATHAGVLRKCNLLASVLLQVRLIAASLFTLSAPLPPSGAGSPAETLLSRWQGKECLAGVASEEGAVSTLRRQLFPKDGASQSLSALHPFDLAICDHVSKELSGSLVQLRQYNLRQSLLDMRNCKAIRDALSEGLAAPGDAEKTDEVGCDVDDLEEMLQVTRMATRLPSLALFCGALSLPPLLGARGAPCDSDNTPGFALFELLPHATPHTPGTAQPQPGRPGSAEQLAPLIVPHALAVASDRSRPLAVGHSVQRYRFYLDCEQDSAAWRHSGCRGAAPGRFSACAVLSDFVSYQTARACRMALASPVHQGVASSRYSLAHYVATSIVSSGWMEEHLWRLLVSLVGALTTVHAAGMDYGGEIHLDDVICVAMDFGWAAGGVPVATSTDGNTADYGMVTQATRAHEMMCVLAMPQALFRADEQRGSGVEDSFVASALPLAPTVRQAKDTAAAGRILLELIKEVDKRAPPPGSTSSVGSELRFLVNRMCEQEMRKPGGAVDVQSDGNSSTSHVTAHQLAQLYTLKLRLHNWILQIALQATEIEREVLLQRREAEIEAQYRSSWLARMANRQYSPQIAAHRMHGEAIQGETQPPPTHTADSTLDITCILPPEDGITSGHSVERQPSEYPMSGVLQSLQRANVTAERAEPSISDILTREQILAQREARLQRFLELYDLTAAALDLLPDGAHGSGIAPPQVEKTAASVTAGRGEGGSNCGDGSDLRRGRAEAAPQTAFDLLKESLLEITENSALSRGPFTSAPPTSTGRRPEKAARALVADAATFPCERGDGQTDFPDTAEPSRPLSRPVSGADPGVRPVSLLRTAPGALAYTLPAQRSARHVTSTTLFPKTARAGPSGAFGSTAGGPKTSRRDGAVVRSRTVGERLATSRHLSKAPVGASGDTSASSSSLATTTFAAQAQSSHRLSQTTRQPQRAVPTTARVGGGGGGEGESLSSSSKLTYAAPARTVRPAGAQRSSADLDSMSKSNGAADRPHNESVSPHSQASPQTQGVVKRPQLQQVKSADSSAVDQSHRTKMATPAGRSGVVCPSSRSSYVTQPPSVSEEAVKRRSPSNPHESALRAGNRLEESSSYPNCPLEAVTNPTRSRSSPSMAKSLVEDDRERVISPQGKQHAGREGTPSTATISLYSVVTIDNGDAVEALAASYPTATRPNGAADSRMNEVSERPTAGAVMAQRPRSRVATSTLEALLRSNKAGDHPPESRSLGRKEGATDLLGTGEASRTKNRVAIRGGSSTPPASRGVQTGSGRGAPGRAMRSTTLSPARPAQRALRSTSKTPIAVRSTSTSATPVTQRGAGRSERGEGYAAGRSPMECKGTQRTASYTPPGQKLTGTHQLTREPSPGSEAAGGHSIRRTLSPGERQRTAARGGFGDVWIGQQFAELLRMRTDLYNVSSGKKVSLDAGVSDSAAVAQGDKTPGDGGVQGAKTPRRPSDDLLSGDGNSARSPGDRGRTVFRHDSNATPTRSRPWALGEASSGRGSTRGSPGVGEEIVDLDDDATTTTDEFRFCEVLDADQRKPQSTSRVVSSAPKLPQARRAHPRDEGSELSSSMDFELDPVLDLNARYPSSHEGSALLPNPSTTRVGRGRSQKDGTF